MLPEHGFEPVTLRIDIFWWKPSYDFFTSLWYCPKMVATFLSGDPGLQQLMSTASPKSCGWPRVCTLSMSFRPLFGYQAPAGEPDKEVKASWLEAWYTSDFCYPSTALVMKKIDFSTRGIIARPQHALTYPAKQCLGKKRLGLVCTV